MQLPECVTISFVTFLDVMLKETEKLDREGALLRDCPLLAERGCHLGISEQKKKNYLPGLTEERGKELEGGS